MAQDRAALLGVLDLAELDALIDTVPAGEWQRIDRAMFLAAAMTGLRQGELIALRWRDIDWPAGRVRVRQNYVRGAFGTPKSRRSTRECSAGRPGGR